MLQVSLPCVVTQLRDSTGDGAVLISCCPRHDLAHAGALAFIEKRLDRIEAKLDLLLAGGHPW